MGRSNLDTFQDSKMLNPIDPNLPLARPANSSLLFQLVQEAGYGYTSGSNHISQILMGQAQIDQPALGNAMPETQSQPLQQV
jgi:hypothetical protein